MAQSGKLLPSQHDQHSTKELNLTVLQRMDRHVEDILTTAGHVTLFQFDTVTLQCVPKDVEGSLFVVKRRTQPRFQFIVMNRQSTDNLVENLLNDFEYEVQSPSLLYRNANQEMNTILFNKRRECEEVASLFDRILFAFSKQPSKPRMIPSSSDYVELEAAPNSVNFEGLLERGPMASSTMPEMQDELLERRLNTVRISPPDNAPAAATRPPTNHSVQSRSSVPASPTLVPKPLTSIISSTTASPLNPLAQPLPHDIPDNPSSGRATLIKPSFFVPPPFSSMHSTSSTPLIQPSTPVQSSHVAPLLQPYTPSNPPHSFPPAMQQGVIITRDGVRDALHRLVKNQHFIEMVYREMNAHNFRYG